MRVNLPKPTFVAGRLEVKHQGSCAKAVVLETRIGQNAHDSILMAGGRGPRVIQLARFLPLR
jgi:hypothetical protein